MERLEKAFQSALLRKLRAIPYSVWHKANDRSSVGVADILGVVRGLPVVLELKRRGERLTPLQYRNLQRFELAGAAVGAVDEENQGNWVRYLTNYRPDNDCDKVHPLAYPERMLPSRKKSPALAKDTGETT